MLLLYIIKFDTYQRMRYLKRPQNGQLLHSLAALSWRIDLAVNSRFVVHTGFLVRLHYGTY